MRSVKAEPRAKKELERNMVEERRAKRAMARKGSQMPRARGRKMVAEGRKEANTQKSAKATTRKRH